MGAAPTHFDRSFMTALENAKRLLPLPELMAHLGMQEVAKKSAPCPFHDDRSNSFSVFPRDSGEWAWNCFAGCGGGDAPAFLAKLDGLSNEEGCRRYIELAGARSGDRRAQRQIVRAQTSAGRAVLEEPKPMPPSVVEAWREGVDRVQAHPLFAAELARWRGWPESFAEYLIGCGTISTPLHQGERGTAFQVVAPVGARGAMTTLPIGYHVRLKPSAAEEKATWRYMPNEATHGQRTPSLPFILGDFETARVLVITEGQWNLLTFALAAGWLGNGCGWPPGVGMIGIRGANGTGAFLKHYRQYWPENVTCLVLADFDKAGSGWTAGARCFATELGAISTKVVVVDCAPHKDFNALYKAGSVGPADIDVLLRSHNISMNAEVAA